MATTRKTPTTGSRTAKPRATRAKADPSLAARTGRTIKQKPYVSAAIATGAVTAVAAAAAGAFFFARRDKSFRDASEELTSRVKDGLSDAGARIKNLAERGSKWVGASDTKTQAEIAEEALSLKETGSPSMTPVDALADDQIKAGAVAY
ncbi:MAG: hypothetical protein ABIT69_06215 [Sphingomicrobium sp.]